MKDIRAYTMHMFVKLCTYLHMQLYMHMHAQHIAQIF